MAAAAESAPAVWLAFAACAAVIGAAGHRLSLYGDVIAEKSGLGRTWIGLILLGCVTSLPELATGISSVTAAGVPDIAVGDVLGSCVFNLLLVVLVDFLHREGSVYTRASHGHILAAAFGTLLIGLSAFAIVLGGMPGAWRIGHLGWTTPVFVLLYGLAMRIVFVFEQRQLAAAAGEMAERYPAVGLRRAVVGYAVAAGVVVGAGVLLPFIGARLAVVMGWEQSFVGTILVAFATSIPELAVTVGALRIGAFDMAIGNLLGSNLFDILVLAVDDVFYLDGPILSAVSKSHVATAVSAMMMNAAAIIGLLYRPPGKILGAVAWVSVLMAAIYVVNAWVLFRHGL
ncbi:MAG: sodium:calcium antiporter [Betaproteobacteria bacterium]|nr:sodium:calcium antiporter [Betaproteobacteria bacterium]